MRSRDEFIERWKRHIAGMALFGIASEAKDGPLARTAKILEIPEHAEQLLGAMYDYLAKDNANGKARPANAIERQAP